MRGYQVEYSVSNPEMHSADSRGKKAATMRLVLEEAMGGRLQDADVLNLGCSTGIIDEALAPHVGTMTGVDIDEPAVAHARANQTAHNVKFRIDDAMALSFDDASFDVVICSQVYEHVPNADLMQAEILRVLRLGGVCYFAATNRWGVIEKHYGLPFLSWLPQRLGSLYLRLAGKGETYYEKHLGYFALKKLMADFRIEDWTDRIMSDPSRYAAAYLFPGQLSRKVARLAYRIARPLFPGYIWLLWKDS